VAQLTLTPREFAQKWGDNATKEKAASQEHFIDLRRMLGEPTPNEADPTGQTYAFEKAVTKAAGGDGFADVWKKDFFGWEYKGKGKGKGKGKDVKAAYSSSFPTPRRFRPRHDRDPDQFHQPQPQALCGHARRRGSRS